MATKEPGSRAGMGGYARAALAEQLDAMAAGARKAVVASTSGLGSTLHKPAPRG